MSHQWRGVLNEYRDRLDVTDATPIITLGEGGTPADPGPGARGAHRREGVGQVRGHEPDRLVQGPRHDDGRVEGGRARREGRDLRVHRQHVGLRRGLRHPRRHHRRRAGARGQDRDGQARAGDRARRRAAAGARQLRRLPRHRARTRRPLPGAPRQLGQQRPHRGPEDRRVRGRRGARRRPRLPLHPGRQRRQLHRVRARLRRRGRHRGVARSARGCSASRPRAARRSCSARS